MKYFFKKNASDNQFFFVLANFCHLTTNIKSSAIHTKDFCEEKVPKSPDFKEKPSEIAIFTQ